MTTGDLLGEVDEEENKIPEDFFYEIGRCLLHCLILSNYIVIFGSISGS